MVGPNASGKTNILEAIFFFFKALSREELLKIPYSPHLPLYWRASDLFYMGDTSSPLRFGTILWISVVEGGATYVGRVRFYAEFLHEEGTIKLHRVEVGTNVSKAVIEEGRIVVEVDAEVVEGLGLERLRRYCAQRRIGNICVGERRIEAPINAVIAARPIFLGLRFVRGSATHVAEYPDFGLVMVLERVEGGEGVYGVAVPFPLMDLVSIFEGVVFLKHPDIGALSEPSLLALTKRLDIRARNLSSVLYSLRARKRLERLEWLMRELFPGVSITFEEVAGRVALMVEENGLRLPPPNMADGLIKTLAIATAVELEPLVLLIDELENSLHVRALEYVFDLLNSLRIPVLVATHSPILADLAGPERTYLVRRDAQRGTIVEGVENVDELRRRLAQYGVAFSDYVFYGR